MPTPQDFTDREFAASWLASDPGTRNFYRSINESWQNHLLGLVTDLAGEVGRTAKNPTRAHMAKAMKTMSDISRVVGMREPKAGHVIENIDRIKFCSTVLGWVLPFGSLWDERDRTQDDAPLVKLGQGDYTRTINPEDV